MGRRRNYGFERRRREQIQQAKQESKRQRKTDRAESGVTGPEMGEAQDTGVRPDTWEWFSPSRGRTVAVDAGSRPSDDSPDDWIPLTDAAIDADASASEDDPGGEGR